MLPLAYALRNLVRRPGRLLQLVIGSALVVLLLGAVAPCDLVELASDALCADGSVAADGCCSDEPATAESACEGAGDGEQVAHVDCCAGCLACCASYLSGLTAGPRLSDHSARTAGISEHQQAPQSLLSIWRPPRS